VGEQEQFSLRLYHEDGQDQYVRQFVSARDASMAFEYYTNSAGAQLGSTGRVVVTDGSDRIVREWKFGQGVTFPPLPMGRGSSGRRKSPRKAPR
jgi:hypothetical protein